MYLRLLNIIFTCLCLHAAHAQPTGAHIIILGIAQDGGYPHAGCAKSCCARAWSDIDEKRYVVSLALVDPAHKKWWLVEATPDIKEQLQYFHSITKGVYNYLPDGIFITHAHIGHYTGLMQLGREVMSTKDLPVYVLPKMKVFLEKNGPWSQLVSLHNIALNELDTNKTLNLDNNISITTFTVPHRDELSETAGFKITTGKKKYLFIPDINKWEKWNKDIISEVKNVDVALVDATFYDNTELPGRNMSEVPHPCVSETMELFKDESLSTRSHIHFIHFNHTNPLLRDSQKQKKVKDSGFHLAQQGEEL